MRSLAQPAALVGALSVITLAVPAAVRAAEQDAPASAPESQPSPARVSPSSHPASPTTLHIVRAVQVRIDEPLPGEVQEIETMVRALGGEHIDSPSLQQIEQQLLALSRYRAARCAVVHQVLQCALSVARSIRRIHFEGVPFRILRSDLAKRLFLRPGQRVDLDRDGTSDRVGRQRRRIQDYLEREGIFGAEVRITAEPVAGSRRLVDLRVTIVGGHTLQVRRIDVEGAGPISALEIRQRLTPSFFEVYSPLFLRERVDALERKHREQGNHPEAQISARPTVDLEARTVDLLVRVHPGPHLEVLLEGEVLGDATALRDQLSFADSGTTDDTEVESGRQALRRYLQEHGFPLAEVKAERAEPDMRHVQVRYHLQRGPRLDVAEVQIRVPPPLTEHALREQLTLGTRSREPHGLEDLTLSLLRFVPAPLEAWLGWDKLGHAVDEIVEADRRHIERTLVARGYPEASVVADLERDGRDRLRVKFRSNLGDSFTLAEIACTGTPSLSCDELRKVMLHQVGGPFLVEALDVDRGRIIGLYAERGFPYAEAELLTDFDQAGRPALHILVVEGPRARLSSLLVDGHLDTARDVINREMAIEPGAALDPREVSAGLRRLRRTGLFTRVRGRYIGIETRKPNLAYQVSLEEKPSLSLDTSLNFSTADLFGLEAELRERNLLGRMVDVDLAGRFGLFIGRHTFARTRAAWPRIWGTPLTLTLSGGYDLSDRPGGRRSFLDNLQLDADMQRTHSVSTRLQLDLAVSERIMVSTSYELSFDAHSLGNPARYDFGLVGPVLSDPSQTCRDEFIDCVRVGAVALRLQYRDIDNPFNPRSGVQVQVSTTLGSRYLLGEGDFAVLAGGVQAYYSIGRLTLAGSLRTALGALLDPSYRLADRRLIPERELILAGGDRTVRGHELGSIGVPQRVVDGRGQPLFIDHDGLRRSSDECDAQPDLNCEPAVVVKPGLLGVVANVEARLNLGHLWIGDVQWAVFIDAAYVSDESPRFDDLLTSTVSDLQNHRMGVGLGTGLRYVTPVGPVALDLAVDPLRLPAVTPHILFGYSF
ncbi:MAG: BamA/TamA family outer membrane protein [Pseudomonadota bacterium]